jgi:hypothetical protein
MLFAVLFWTLRVSYWSTVSEEPFSDMANFDQVAHGIAASWTFDWSPFWKTYTTPVLPTARAFQIIVFGETLTAWRMFQATLTFAATLWLAYEIYLNSGSRALAFALLFGVALSKPSIFWSLKLAREGLHEVLVYALSACFLFSVRTRRSILLVPLGILTAALFLNRANSLPLLPIVALMITVSFLTRIAGSNRAHWRPGVMALIVFSSGVALLWTPWIIRSWNLYGEPVLLSTQGPYGILWELGEISVSLADGKRITTDVNRLQQEAGVSFTTDLAASKYAGEIALAWLRGNVNKLPALSLSRVETTIYDRSIYLTKVPRQNLYGNYIDRLLIDKTPFRVFAGLLGLLILGLLYRWEFLFLFAATTVPWLSAAVLVGYPRMLEPAIPMILFGNVAWVALLYRATAHARARVISSWTSSH